MKFHLAINLERIDDTLDMRDVARHTLEMVQMADAGGFRIAWAAEHHALEMTIMPNPFSVLSWWSAHTNNIRLGTAVIAAPYWHPIKAAGEAAFVDLISGGRLEFGIGSGAYQREFDRMRPGLKQTDAWRYMQEMLPVIRELWKGDYEHNGEFWSFPTATSCPKPLQKEVPVWVAARAPITYDYAVKHGCNIQSWPLTRDMGEAQLYMDRLNEAVANNPGARRPTMAMMRHTALYDRKEDWMVPVRAAQRQLSQFENLFKNMGDVENGFSKSIPFDQLGNRAEYDPEMLSRNLMFGTPDEVIAKLKEYEAIGVDEFIYYASLGLGLKEQKRSLELFCKEVIPAFA
ncbi:LLM class flavin-dependent oxidoreductase [Tabrizicola sp.]|jgi:alkanesulfonate monooxygenase SsuD/methylene tetrahydromethanopterin reductase-like flavin-dependent oxidoreductase (luciferase family)|uniref:LLM class flavin-dependent oxidoreductase n=1 Tax=Tabrizicola sp. TaxID=2005166 RepID=UPI001A39DB9A|nr:LLM class flavin-dependent oxidoreductase [Tabrizicola sp.]MBL9064582.1 LLM class flavin-dependent oxidoreductase [Tabrizicola sp.]